jgi:serine/threonine protein kinase
MNQERDDPIDDVGTWNQPPPSKGADPTVPPGEPIAGGISHTRNEAAFPSDDKWSTPSDTPDPSGDTGDDDSRKPDNDKRERARAVHGSSEWDIIAPPLIAQGEVLFGKYRLDEQIGEGGMGSVWKVWHVDMESERALKLIKPEIAQNDRGWKRFRREAQLMDKIKHPGAVRVHDYKRTQGLGYIELEFVRGRSLDQILKSRDGEPMPLIWTARVLEQLCAVLQEAHGHVDEKTGAPKPIIHRDLKPSNLMLIDVKHDEDAIRLKVLDFGIAKMIEDDGGGDQTVTGAGDLLGTPAYMSPEQIMSAIEKDGDKRPIDGRSDLYSTGVVLYHLLTGVRPFRGNSMGLIHAHLTTAPPPMKESSPRCKVPPEVERVVMQCLEKDPAKRPQSARELADSFLKAVEPPRPWGPESRWAALIGIVAVLIASVTIGFLSAARSKAAGSRRPVMVDQTPGAALPGDTPESPLSQSGPASSGRSKSHSRVVEIQPPKHQESNKSTPSSSETIAEYAERQRDLVPKTETKAIDIELKTSNPSNVFSLGDAMTIVVVNRSNQPIYIELIATNTRGEKKILTPNPEEITAHGNLRLRCKDDYKPAKEQITVYASATPFLSSTLQSGEGAADRVIHSFDPRLIVEKTITIETRAVGSESVPIPSNESTNGRMAS